MFLGKEVIANDRLRVSDKEQVARSLSEIASDIREIKTVLKLRVMEPNNETLSSFRTS